jgi:hypothetical protein
MGGNAMRWLLSVAVGVLLGLSVVAAGSAGAQPIPPPPPGPGSTSEELADMVMDVIENGGIDAPTDTSVPAPR